jgi:putative toxin-antitoxin system antitoxin component (TIGR02293 family)
MEQAAEHRRSVAATLLPPVRRMAASKAPYAVVGEFSAVDHIAVVKQGLPAQWLNTLAADMDVPRERLLGWLGIARTTANRRLREGELLSQDESERALGLAALIGQVHKIVLESGEPKGFDAPRWAAAFLAAPSAALGGRTPGEFMDTAAGRGIVTGLVAQMQSGAYA